MENLEIKPDQKLHICLPPSANWKFRFGDNPNVYFQFYIKNPPNRFQRWMFKKILGVTWEPVESN